MWFSLKIAISSLKTHRVRTALAVVGALLGALALTAVQSISEAMYAKAEAETAKLGTNLFLASSGQIHFHRGGSGAVRHEANTFTLRDAQALIGQLPAARLGAPFASATMPVRFGDTKVPSQLVANTPGYAGIRNLQLADGRFFSSAEEDRRARVVILGRTIAKRLFGRPDDALGKTVLMFRAPVRAIGVLATHGRRHRRHRPGPAGFRAALHLPAPFRQSGLDQRGLHPARLDPGTTRRPRRRPPRSCAAATGSARGRRTTSRLSPPATPSSSRSRPWPWCRPSA